MKPLQAHTFARTLAALATLAATPLGAEVAFAPQRVELRLSFDGETAATLAAMGEWVTVSAYYFGDSASPDAPQEEDGSVYLGGETLQVYPRDQIVLLGGGLDGMPRDWVVEPRINVNIFTARFAADDNLILCDFVEGPVSALVAEGAAVSCTMLGN